jgi:hypothetical protein
VLLTGSLGLKSGAGQPHLTNCVLFYSSRIEVRCCFTGSLGLKSGAEQPHLTNCVLFYSSRIEVRCCFMGSLGLKSGAERPQLTNCLFNRLQRGSAAGLDSHHPLPAGIRVR